MLATYCVVNESESFHCCRRRSGKVKNPITKRKIFPKLTLKMRHVHRTCIKYSVLPVLYIRIGCVSMNKFVSVLTKQEWWNSTRACGCVCVQVFLYSMTARMGDGERESERAMACFFLFFVSRYSSGQTSNDSIDCKPTAPFSTHLSFRLRSTLEPFSLRSHQPKWIEQTKQQPTSQPSNWFAMLSVHCLERTIVIYSDCLYGLYFSPL